MLELYISTKKTINTIMDFEFYDIEKKEKKKTKKMNDSEDLGNETVILMDVGRELLDVNNKVSIYKEDFDLNEIDELGIHMDIREKLDHYLTYLINDTLILFEEVFMHQNSIKHNIEAIKHTKNIIDILKEKREK